MEKDTYNRVLIDLKLILELLKDVLKITLFFHYLKYELEHFLVDLLHQVSAMVLLHHPLLAVDKDYFNNVWELLREHLVKKQLLFFLNHQVLFIKVFVCFVK